MLIVQTAPHEFDANFIFSEYGLRPYFGIDAAVKQVGGSVESHFEQNGERWAAKLYYTRDSNIVHPGERTPAGTKFELETIREFRIKVKKSGDDAGQKSFNAHIAPRWDGMKGEKSDGSKVSIPVPNGIEEAVNIRIQGSNIEFDRYHDLLKRAFAAVGVRSHYFATPHEHSNITDIARYVRLHRDLSGPIHARDGPIASLGHLLESDREGYRKVVQNDNDTSGSNLPGWYHTVTLGQRRIREAFPSHDLPKEIKHYYAREAKGKDKSDPLAHPKLEVSYQRSRWDGKLGVDEIEKVNRELNQTIYSILADAGIQTHQGDGPFLSDAYFSAENIETDDNPIISLNLTQIEHDQTNVVVKHLTGGLSPVEQESLTTLVTDGGRVSPKDIAEEHDRHPDSVRRALKRIDELVQREYGEVSLRSPHVAELVHKSIEEAKKANERVIDTASKALEAAERGLNGGTSALIAWAANHDLDISDDSDGYIDIRLGTVEAEDMGEIMNEIRRRLRDGKRLWTDAGRDPKYWEGGSYSASAVFDQFADCRSISREERKNVSGYVGATI